MADTNRGVDRKLVLRCLTDFGMTLLLLALMAYSVTGQAVHEWMGIGMLVLFLLHHGLNVKWLWALTKGRYTPARILQTALVFLLLLSAAAQIASGFAMARHLPAFLRLPIPMHIARLLHMACGYWSFLLMGLHLGLHWGVFLGLGRRLRGGRSLLPAGRWAVRTLAVVAAAWGAVCFVGQDMFDYLFLRTEFVFFDYEKFPLLALGELAAIMALWTLIGYFLRKLLPQFKKTKSCEKRDTGQPGVNPG